MPPCLAIQSNFLNQLSGCPSPKSRNSVESWARVYGSSTYPVRRRIPVDGSGTCRAGGRRSAASDFWPLTSAFWPAFRLPPRRSDPERENRVDTNGRRLEGVGVKG